MKAVRSGNVAAVILAAGDSTRLGRAKQHIVLDESTGETLLERAVRVAVEAGLAPVIAVLRPEGGHGDALQRMGALVVRNDHAAEGMASSIRCGVNTATLLKVDGTVVLACDQPALCPDHLRALCADPDRITGSRYAGRTGVPAYFPATAFAALMTLEGDTGARDLLRNAATVMNEALAFDIDTPEDLVKQEIGIRK